MEDLKTYTYGPVADGQPQQLVVLLHGLGADGQDLIDLARPFSAKLPHAVFVAPDAPFPCDMAPVGRQWFSLQDRAPAAILSGVQGVAPILQDFIDGQLAKYNLSDEALALVGFSQGTMMALYAGPRRKAKIAGILAYSGALIGEGGQDMAAFQKPPVRLIHGTADMIVPVAAYHRARDMLTQAGFTVSGGATEGLSHGIDPAGIAEGTDFLEKIAFQQM